MLSRRHLVAVAAVISVVLLTLTAWHRHPGNGPANAQASAHRTASSTASQPASRPASRSTSASATRSPSRSVTPHPQLTVQQLSANLRSLFGPADSFSVAGYDLTTGHSIAAGASSGMTEASVVKLDILQTALYRQQSGLDLNEDDVEAMIEHSDNAAADRVYARAGRNSALQQYNDTVGLSHTQLDPNGLWGLSTTAATDELTLLKQLVSSRSPLTAASRGYALQLMGDVEADQRWGISAAADPGASSELKNGWLNIDRDNGLWAVNSVGLTTSGGHKVLLAVLSQHQPDMQTGVSRVAAAAKQLAVALRST